MFTVVSAGRYACALMAMNPLCEPHFIISTRHSVASLNCSDVIGHVMGFAGDVVFTCSLPVCVGGGLYVGMPLKRFMGFLRVERKASNGALHGWSLTTNVIQMSSAFMLHMQIYHVSD